MQSIKTILKKYFSSFFYFYKYLNYRLFIVVALSIFIGIMDGIGLTMFLPLLQMTDGSTTFASSEGLGNMSFIINGLHSIGIILTLKSALSLLFIFFAIKGFISYISMKYKVVAHQYFISKLRIKLTNLFTNYSFRSFISADIGRIQNSFTAEIQRVTSAYQYYSNGMQQLILTMVYLIFVFTIDWQFALLVCLGGGITNLFFSRIYKRTKNESSKLSKNNSHYQGLIIQYINNYKYLKATGLLEKYNHKLVDTIKTIEVNNTIIGKLNAMTAVTREPVLVGVVCMVIAIQVFVMGGNLGSILISLLFFYRALTSLMSFQNGYNNFLAVSGSLDNVADFEQELQKNIEVDGKISFSTLAKGIELEQVGFGYSPAHPILKNINLNIQKNTTIAFVGESGSGKSTLVNLLTGLLPNETGSLRIDGTDIKNLNKADYQKRIGYITQEPVIFNDTIYNNITLWDEVTPENTARFEQALKKASLYNFVMGLELQEQNLLGNNGINLSGGQKQRISIARELYKDIDILILDEATSALDSQTEKEIQENIDSLKGAYTVIVIAHRLSTIKNSDQIYLLEKGQIEAQGSFSSLLGQSERFRKMVELQEI